MNDWRDGLVSAAACAGTVLDGREIHAFGEYLDLIVEVSGTTNVMSFSNKEEIAVRHFADSLACLKVLPSGRLKCIDIGSGAGLPGIPLKIVRPELEMVLLESVGKKARFLEKAVRKLELLDTTVIARRAEDLARNDAHRESYDVALSRAAAVPSATLEYELPFVRIGGSGILYLGDNTAILEREKDDIMRVLGGRFSSTARYRLREDDMERTVVRVEKTAGTFPEYPRRAGIPKKRPL